MIRRLLAEPGLPPPVSGSLDRPDAGRAPDAGDATSATRGSSASSAHPCASTRRPPTSCPTSCRSTRSRSAAAGRSSASERSPGEGASLRLRYLGEHVFLVLGAPAGGGMVEVNVDGEPSRPSGRGGTGSTSSRLAAAEPASRFHRSTCASRPASRPTPSRSGRTGLTRPYGGAIRFCRRLESRSEAGAVARIPSPAVVAVPPRLTALARRAPLPRGAGGSALPAHGEPRTRPAAGCSRRGAPGTAGARPPGSPRAARPRSADELAGEALRQHQVELARRSRASAPRPRRGGRPCRDRAAPRPSGRTRRPTAGAGSPRQRRASRPSSRRSRCAGAKHQRLTATRKSRIESACRAAQIQLRKTSCRKRSPRHQVPLRTRLRTRSGCASASSCAIAPPIDDPTTCGRSSPTSSMSAIVSAAKSPIANGPSGVADRPTPRLSKVVTR